MLLTAHTDFFRPMSIVCTVCMSGIQHALLIRQIITHCTYGSYILKGHYIDNNERYIFKY
jgi:hypothetical protein